LPPLASPPQVRPMGISNYCCHLSMSLARIRRGHEQWRNLELKYCRYSLLIGWNSMTWASNLNGGETEWCAVTLFGIVAMNWDYAFRRCCHKNRNLPMWSRLLIHIYFRFLFALHYRERRSQTSLFGSVSVVSAERSGYPWASSSTAVNFVRNRCVCTNQNNHELSGRLCDLLLITSISSTRKLVVLQLFWILLPVCYKGAEI
jgi:hypothetical protein